MVVAICGGYLYALSRQRPAGMACRGWSKGLIGTVRSISLLSVVCGGMFFADIGLERGLGDSFLGLTKSLNSSAHVSSFVGTTISRTASEHELKDDEPKRRREPCNHTVLVLGSSELVGSSLVKRLRADGCLVLEVKHRHHVDLRVRGSLASYAGKLDFCFFLACEVGGSK